MSVSGKSTSSRMDRAMKIRCCSRTAGRSRLRPSERPFEHRPWSLLRMFRRRFRPVSRQVFSASKGTLVFRTGAFLPGRVQWPLCRLCAQFAAPPTHMPEGFLNLRQPALFLMRGILFGQRHKGAPFFSFFRQYPRFSKDDDASEIGGVFFAHHPGPDPPRRRNLFIRAMASSLW